MSRMNPHHYGHSVGNPEAYSCPVSRDSVNVRRGLQKACHVLIEHYPGLIIKVKVCSVLDCVYIFYIWHIEDPPLLVPLYLI